MKTKHWSSVLNVITDIKEKYINKFNAITYNKGDYETCLIRWIAELNDELYLSMFESIQTSQNGELVLVRYGEYSDVFGGESEIVYGEFWDRFDNFYRECRSIVINVVSDEIAILPFNKFFNINELDETNIDVVKERMLNAKSIEITDKLDGSMQCARFYNNKIIMSGSKSLSVNDSWRLADGYKMLTTNENYVQMLTENPDLTFIFEYLSYEDSHVVIYSEDDYGLHLIGVRNTITGELYSYNVMLDYAKKYNVKTTTLFVDKTLDEIMESLDDYKSNEKEGFVLNIDNFMVKIKYNDYVAMHKILSQISSINLIIKAIGDGIFDDFISKIPTSYRQRVLDVAKKIFKYISLINADIEKYYNQTIELEFVEKMKYIQQNAPKSLQGMIINKVKGNEINVIKRKSGNYIKIKEIENFLLEKENGNEII
jgi:hypothetical protein